MKGIEKYKSKRDNKFYYRYRLRYKDPLTQKYKEKSESGFATKKEAELAKIEMRKKYEEGYELTSMSLSEYLKHWLLEYKKGTVRNNTYILHERNVNKHILPYFNNILLKDIKPIMYQKFINSLYDNGYKKRTIEIVHGTMYNALEKAVIIGKLEKNPCAGVTIKGESKEQKLQYIESKDISRFLTEAYKYDYIYWIFFKVLIETGMRKGEAAALQWTDIDLKEGTINISKTFDFQEASKTSDKTKIFGDTKTYNSKRIISIGRSLANDLHYHKIFQNQNKIALNEIYYHDLNLVLCRNDGNYMPKSSLFNAFLRILKRADIPSLPIHSLRHTHAVLQMEAGADMKYLQERLGHGSMQITADVYAHISKKLEQEKTSKFEEYIQGIIN